MDSRGILRELGLVATGVALLCACANAHAQRVGYVSQDRLIHESALAKGAEARLKAEFSSREEELRSMTLRLQTAVDRLDHESSSLSDGDRMRRQREVVDLDRDVRRRRRDFQDDLARRKDQELAMLLERTSRLVRQIGEAEGYDVILEKGQFVGARIDITDRVIAVLNAASQK